MWTQSADGERTIFTPGEGDAHPGLRRLIYDPSAPAGARVVAELEYFFDPDDSLEAMKAKLGL